MKKFMREFKEFAARGNVIDLAVGVVIGGAFKGVVDSLINDVISPILGAFRNADFSEVTLKIGGITLMVGSFLMAVLNFLIMAFVIFVLVKGINALRKPKQKETVALPAVKICPYCRSEIAEDATRCRFCTSELK